MSLISTPETMPRLLQPYQYANVGHIPQAGWMRRLSDVVNHCRRWRGKELYSSAGAMIIPTSGGAAARARCYFRCHTGYGARRFLIGYSIARAKAVAASPGGIRFTAVPVGGGSTITRDITYGAIDAGTTVQDALDELGIGIMITADCVENKTYECTVEDFQEGRLQHVVVLTEAKAPDTANGYLDPNFAVNQDILDKHRQDLVQKATELYLQNSQPLINFSTNLDSSVSTIAGATETNIVDGTSTAVNANTPGFYVDLTYKRTLARATVPVVFAVLAQTTAGILGVVKLKDSTGTIATISGITTVKGWFTTTANLTANAGKRDIHANADAPNSIKVFAACCYLKD